MMLRIISLVALLHSVDGFGSVNFKEFGIKSLRNKESVNIQFGCKRTALRSTENANDGNDRKYEENCVPVPKTSVTINDGVSDFTDRFKYKVNALMGSYDPTSGPDDENQDGNIFNAMLNFPTQHTFNVVGKTNGQDDVLDDFVDSVKKMVSSLSGEEKLDCRVTPRGNNYTTVRVKVSVESTAMINTITTELKEMGITVMSF